ncbi:MAG: hypothetical protein M3R38_01780 [Actinomycetota bacterium]|nr:hypothetical protein [Actinomycetota bacterium]
MPRHATMGWAVGLLVAFVLTFGVVHFGGIPLVLALFFGVVFGNVF